MEIQDIKLTGLIKLEQTDGLIVIDMQNDFLPGGALAVNEGDMIIPGINNLTSKFIEDGNPVIFTQDWHPPSHKSFASSYPDKNPGDPIETPGIGPILWPDHCIQETPGASLAPGLANIESASLILRKGFHPTVDSYSAFLENDKVTDTGLQAFLDAMGITRIFLCGLALDYCVYFTAIDAKSLGFDVVLVADLTKPVNAPPGSVSNALSHMRKEKVLIVTADQILI
ncbi:MAG: bifunctional nicotinamidase/pyrazinamidase [Candidatus Heimdallarchaeota archaeon]|nr:bifunctional nicotinamidase/pyrazinamidase [Candidatus Heimdallarchaeota archaeon]